MSNLKQSVQARAKQLADGWVQPVNNFPKVVLLLMAVCLGWVLFRSGAQLTNAQVCSAAIALGIFYLVAIYGLCLRGVSALEKGEHDDA